MGQLKKSMPGYFAAIIAVSIAAIAVSPAMAQETESSGDWVPLFDGESIEGWTQRGGEAVYEVEDGRIVGTAVPDTPNSFLCTNKQYDNFELEYEFWVDDGLNSGVQIRSDSRPDYQNGRVHGYQVEIDPSQRSWSGGIYDEGRSGWLATLETNAAAREAFRHSTWNSIRVRAEGDRIQTWINDIPAVDFEEATVPTGFIGLQVHSVGNDKTNKQVRWRNLRIRELPPEEDNHE